MHVHQFWWAWSLQFRRYYYLLKRPNFPFGAWTIVHGHQKIQSIGIGSKNSCKYGLMSSVYTPILVGVVSLLLEILLPSKTAKFQGMDYSPWSSKNSMDRNWLKKFMQVGVDVTCMYFVLVGVASPVLVLLLFSFLNLMIRHKVWTLT